MRLVVFHLTTRFAMDRVQDCARAPADELVVPSQLNHSGKDHAPNKGLGPGHGCVDAVHGVSIEVKFPGAAAQIVKSALNLPCEPVQLLDAAVPRGAHVLSKFWGP